jgi:alpha-L-fucosidase
MGSIDPPKSLASILVVALSTLMPVQAQTTEDLQRAFSELRFGMFVHFSIMTFTGAPWATPNQDVTKFNPTNLDCAQWADAAAAAGMKFGILTTKHHDGFCLWNSKYTENDLARSPWKNGQGDVVREFVDAFRARGLEPCLYYSVWDNTKGVGNGPITAQDMEFIKGQITELLTNYGDIRMLFIDGWSWKMGHKSVPYDEIRTLVKSLQPRCLLVDNTHLRCLYDNDLIHFEAGTTCPADNTLPALQSQLINRNSGDDWFWDQRVPTATLMSVNEIVQINLNYLEPRWCTFVLNCPPNREGKLDSTIVARLREVGQAWRPNMSRPPLPAQAAFIEQPITPLSATATSGNAYYAVDGLNDRFTYTVWQSSTSLPQSITIDVGKEYDDVSILSYVPKYVPIVTPSTQGSIRAYKIYKSTDNANFTEVAGGEWDGSINMKVATFPPTRARYIWLEALTAVDSYAAATEIAIGRGSIASRVKDPQGRVSPGQFILGQNYPNPFNPETAINFQTLEPSRVRLEVYNVLGQKVTTLVDEYRIAGAFSAHWFGQDKSGGCTPSGAYFYRMEVHSPNETFSSSRKMILLR